MYQQFIGKLTANKATKLAIIATRTNQFVVDKLLDGAIASLQQHGLTEQNLVIVRVPGAYELPLAAQHWAKQADINGLVSLAAVIRGQTPHFDYVAGECISGLMRVSLDSRKPVGLGVLTTDTLEQAIERSGGKAGNKGSEAALSVLEMMDLLVGGSSFI